MIKKALVLLLSLCLTLGLASPAFAAGFSDIAENAWYYENVTRMTDMKVITGYPDGTFRPDGNITCGEFLTVLMKTLTGTESYPSETGHWASAVLQAAYAEGVCTDADMTEADLDTPIIRADAAKYTANAVSRILKEKSVSTAGMESIIADYANVAGSGCEKEILDMYARGIITGDTSGNFNPANNIRRSEAATIVLRAYDKTVRQLPFGIAASLESAYSDRAVLFISCIGEKYDVKSLSVAGMTANGVNIDFKCINTETGYKDLINANSTIRRAYEGREVPDAVLKFDWPLTDLKKLSVNFVNDQPVIDLQLVLNVDLSDGTVLPFTYSVSYCITSYGGLL